MKLCIHSQNAAVQSLNFGYGKFIWFHSFNGCNYLSMLGVKLSLLVNGYGKVIWFHSFNGCNYLSMLGVKLSLLVNGYGKVIWFDSFNGCNYLSMLGVKLSLLVKRASGSYGALLVSDGAPSHWILSLSNIQLISFGLRTFIDSDTWIFCGVQLNIVCFVHFLTTSFDVKPSMWKV